MTRSLEDASVALTNPQPGLSWAVGCHPGLLGALNTWDRTTFEDLTSRSLVIGEVGLDRRSGLPLQQEVFSDILAATNGCLVSVHSAGRVEAVLECVENSHQSGVILHWFLGDKSAVERAVALGCFFSINAAMSDDTLRGLPFDRVLPETDFPASRGRTGASKPGDVRQLEMQASRLSRKSPSEIREHWYRVLSRAFDEADAWGRAPAPLRELVLRAQG
jgi:TatD DNase family protein